MAFCAHTSVQQQSMMSKEMSSCFILFMLLYACRYSFIVDTDKKKTWTLLLSTLSPDIAKHPMHHIRVKAHAIAWASVLLLLVLSLNLANSEKVKSKRTLLFQSIFVCLFSYRHYILEWHKLIHYATKIHFFPKTHIFSPTFSSSNATKKALRAQNFDVRDVRISTAMLHKEH